MCENCFGNKNQSVAQLFNFLFFWLVEMYEYLKKLQSHVFKLSYTRLENLILKN